MRKTILIISSLWLLTLSGCGNKDSLEVETPIIDEIPHILNPAQPLKGRILLYKEDYQIYREYKVKNLPEIFEK